MKKYLLYLISALIIGFLLSFIYVNYVQARETVTICHATSSNVNPYVQEHPAKNGDVSGHDDHNGGVYPTDSWGDIIPPFSYFVCDFRFRGSCIFGHNENYSGKNWNDEGQAIYKNECEIPEVEVTPTPTNELTSTLTPTATPSATLTPTLPPNSGGGFELGGPPVRECSEIKYTPTIIGYKRVSSTSVYVNWTATDPIDDYFVYYGLTPENLEWNTYVENAHETTLNELPANQSIWFNVRGTDGVCQGNPSITVDP